MKINVATRVIGGFSIVTLLLILLGGVTLLTNSSIKDSTATLQSISLPALNATNDLSENISSQQVQALLAYYSNHSSKIPPIEQRLKQQANQFNQQLDKLAQLIVNQAEFSTPLSQLKSSYAQFENISQTVLNERNSALSEQEALLVMRGKLEDAADDASSLLMDITDLDSSDDQTEKSLAASAGLVETNFINIITTVYDLVSAEDTSKYELIVKELDYMVSEIKNKIDYINRQGDGIVDEDVLADLNKETDKVFAQLSGNNSLIALKASQINHEQTAHTKLAEMNSALLDVNAKMKVLARNIDAFATEISNNAISSIDQASINTMMVVALAIVVAVGVSYAVVKPLTQSLAKVNQALTVLASGDLTHKLDDSGHDEFAELSTNCNLLVDSLRRLIVGILDRSNQLAAAAEQTSAITSQTTVSIKEQKNQVDQIATATTELSSSAQQVSLSADHALEQIKQADQETQHMRKIAEENKLTILSLADEIGKANIVINKLHSDSAAIGSILDVIRGIAEQTNLLALNAAIEAARAGEQGRGFAVVADEVRSLASRTQVSTQEIQQMIEVLQKGAQQAVGAMDLGREQANTCVEKTEQANLALESISQSVHQAFDAGNHIAHAAQEQNLVSSQVSEKLEHIASISEETATGASQTSESSHQVAKLAEELQASVGEFKV